MSETLLRTPLYEWHVRQGARMVPFAGWEMPVQYTGILEEHRTTRTTAGLFDVSHMGEATVRGPGAAALVDHIATNRMADLAPGRARYTLMCAPDGGVVDDIIVYRKGADHFFICLNAGNTPGDVAWLKQQAAGFDCTVEDVSANYAQLALQGPKAVEIAVRLSADVSAIGRFHFAEAVIAGIPVMASRTGYTGEDGFEFYVAPGSAVALADALLEAGRDLGLRPCGLGARDSLRLEAGLPLYGHEISREISPLQAGLGWAVKLDKPEFIGRVALKAEAAAKPARRVVFFTLDDRRIARAGAVVLAEGTPAGTVLSGTMSPLLNKPIGSALVERAVLEAGRPLSVDLRGTLATLRVAKPPLHKTA